MLRLGQHGTEAGLETQVTSATSVVPYEASPSVVLTAAETPPRFAPFASVPSRRLAFAVACSVSGRGLVSDGGFVIIDDYGGLPPCRLAVEDFRTAHDIGEPIVPIDWTGVYWRVSRALTLGVVSSLTPPS